MNLETALGILKLTRERYNIINMGIFCPWDPPQHLIFSSNIPTLLYYSHFLSIIVAGVFFVFLINKVKESVVARIFVVVIGLFILWTFLDILLWASNQVDVVLFYWSIQVLSEVFVYAGSFYLTYTFVLQKGLPFKLKVASAVLLLPIIVLLPTKYLFPGIDVYTCNAMESSFVIIYSYSIEVLFTLSILFVSFQGLLKQSAAKKKEIVLFLFGIVFFLIAFASGNIIGSITGDWNTAQVGLFGMPIFTGFLAYLVVKFKTFEVKTFGAQVLVIALAILIGSEFFFVTTMMNQVLVAITFVLSCAGGFLLVKSVKGEIKAKESLEVANAGQTNLIHIINHQIKGYLAKGRNVFAELIEEPSYGITAAAKPMVEGGFDALTEGVDFVQQVLTSSSAEKGTLVYNMEPFDFKELVLETAAKQKGRADDKNLSYKVFTGNEDYTIVGDATQLKEAVRNLIDNSIIYTPSGSVNVGLSRSGDKVLFSVKDTGVGIADEDKARLFTTGGKGKESSKLNANSTGYGLAFVKGVVTAHKGRVWAESDGSGKGSQFYMELPVGK